MGSNEKQNHDWSNYWNGRTASETGEVFGLVEVESNADLASFWSSVFDRVAEAKIVDLACGAGSVLKHVDQPKQKDLIGVDISRAALDIAESNVPGMRGIVASADKIPLADQYADMIVSQFGFEYAGKAVAPEVARILKPNGVFVAVAHMKNSSIELECRQHLTGLKTIEDSHFIHRAKAMIEAIVAFERGRSTLSREDLTPLIEQFTDAQSVLLSLAPSNRIAAHLYDGTKQLFERRAAYEYSDIEGWLNGMDCEIDAYKGRMSSMIGAAITEQEARDFLHQIGVANDSELSVFKIDNDNVGWILKTKRSLA